MGGLKRSSQPHTSKRNRLPHIAHADSPCEVPLQPPLRGARTELSCPAWPEGRLARGPGALSSETPPKPSTERRPRSLPGTSWLMTVQPQDESLSLEISDIFKELERKETRRSSAPGLLSLPGIEPGRPSDRDLRLVPFGRLSRAETAAAGGNADRGGTQGSDQARLRRRRLPSPRAKPAQLRAWGGPRWSAAVLRPAGPPSAKRAQPALGGACRLGSRGRPTCWSGAATGRLPHFARTTTRDRKGDAAAPAPPARRPPGSVVRLCPALRQAGRCGTTRPRGERVRGRADSRINKGRGPAVALATRRAARRKSRRRVRWPPGETGRGAPPGPTQSSRAWRTRGRC